MHDSHPQSVSRLLQELGAGNRGAFDELLPLVYDELHRIAEGQRRRWDGDETLNTTALVNEAYFRLVDQSAPEWQSRTHFLALASTAMRQILIDYARAKRTSKRGPGPHVALHAWPPPRPVPRAGSILPLGAPNRWSRARWIRSPAGPRR
jgi:RNA polymerase sigma factor (TIGR02999 family)